ncbi:hypothetical protein ISF_02789 [Cordyceps fumosorosea ARSEF 2679]|uniref:Uncharacterized protein n=1 Tax=Cordyceps fumosorosea (strain ARSEF 2679) TaxID=1081104 RepID=A0A162MSD5_CORFA|nr:hypothetical protein ISF_02789 [Cordyceps fumosorosea ARSEF 2679]OAA69519.1 hypothetical protein ISF_02789 [Cordyceps fumosorosea ARSEF 2679]
MSRRFPKKARKTLEKHGDAGIEFEDSGKHPLVVPGFGGMRVPTEGPAGERFAHGFGDWSQNRLTARELAMLRLMNAITDRPNWHVEVGDPAVVAQWAREAASWELISPAAWDWCLAELLDKAVYYEKVKLTHVFDTASRICKSDYLISPSLLEKMTAEVDALTRAPDLSHQCHEQHQSLPLEGETQTSLVDPDMFPLIFGETHVLSDGGSVRSVNAADHMGRGVRSQEQKWSCSRSPWGRCDGNPTRGMEGVPQRAAECTVCRHFGGSPEEPWRQRAYMFSPRFQWLPSEVCFGPPDARTTGMRLTSYINNLHPRHHFSLYRSIEAVVEASVQPWNEILAWTGRGRTPERIRTYGVQWTPQEPTPVELEELDEIMRAGQGELYAATKARLDAFLARPDNPRAPPPSWQYPQILPDWAATYSPSAAVKLKHRRCKAWLHPEPGAAFTYAEWKAGRNNRAVVPGRAPDWQRGGGQLPPKEDHAFYQVSLETQFARRGLQVVVEIGAVELTPARPTRAATPWRLAGLLSDRIVATAMVYLDSDNVADAAGALSFRVEADLDPLEHVWGGGTGSGPHHPLAPLAEIYGLDSPLDLDGGAPALQELGTVLAPDGRLVAFPNAVQHRVEAFRLRDPRRPGRRRWLAVHLVDPHVRVCSTRAAPPQQPGWWADAGWDRVDWRARRVPPELVDAVRGMIGERGPGRAEVESRRKEMREERERKQEQVMSEEVTAYMFDEHAAIGRKFLR